MPGWTDWPAAMGLLEAMFLSPLSTIAGLPRLRIIEAFCVVLSC